MMKYRRILMPTEKEILNGECTDVYFPRSIKILKAKEFDDTKAVMEVYLKKFPDPNYNFGMFTGIHDVVRLLEYVAKTNGSSIDVYAMEDGEIFFPEEPVLQVIGKYTDFGIYENTVLGLICQASGVSTEAARVRMAAGPDKELMAFGTRRVHPALAPMVERSCYIGGFDAVSNVKGAELIGLKPKGTMLHAYVLIVGNSRDAFRYYDEVVPPEVPRIALVDTFGSIKEETFIALETLGKKLDGIRIDRDDLEKLGKEMRWELDIRGRRDVKLYCSGGLNEYSVAKLSKIYDGFGVGTSVAHAPTMNFAKKLIEVNDEPRAKVGNRSGAKFILRHGNIDKVYRMHNLDEPRQVQHTHGGELLLKPWMKDGKIVKKLDSVDEIRERNLKKLYSLPDDLKSLYRIKKYRVDFVGS